jgi:16S rRNA (guanine527-N7)-methyltransferase
LIVAETLRLGKRSSLWDLTEYGAVIFDDRAIIISAMKELARYAMDMLGLQLTNAQLNTFKRYERELVSWNKQVNLTAIDHPNKIRTKHFLDSLTCLLAMRDTPMERVVDVGTGAGFPGLPLKIVYPAMRLTLVESVGKKASFCQHIVAALGLEGVEILQERAEVVGMMAAHREQYDWALARAVAVMPILMEYLLPLVQIGGRALAMKGESAPAEAHTAERGIQLLGGHFSQLMQVTLPGVEDERYLVIVDKVAATPDKYPRRVGIPAKRPL